jgi:hypothetical protein
MTRSPERQRDIERIEALGKQLDEIAAHADEPDRTVIRAAADWLPFLMGQVLGLESALHALGKDGTR